MDWRIKSGDILNEPADTLICSANGFLDLSGGVGAAIRMRYGMQMQEQLHAIRSERGSRPLARGEIVVTPSCGSSYRFVIHAVAVDTFYQSDATVITKIVDKALHEAAERHAGSVALVALATGYGPLTMADFADGLRPLLGNRYRGLMRSRSWSAMPMNAPTC